MFRGDCMLVLTDGTQNFPATLVSQYLRRVFVDQVTLGAQYPFSTTRRFEVNVGYAHLGYSTRVQRFADVGFQVVDLGESKLPSPPGLGYATTPDALVGDNAFFAFTSPVLGWRYRFEVAPTFGSIDFYSATADYRRYIQLSQVTLALRGLHFGRYGRDAEDPRLSPLWVGDPTLVRGYDPNSFKVEECTQSIGGGSGCPEFDRLIGSRLGVANAELRIPLFGTREYGIFRTSFLPVELAPFVDGGIAWTSAEGPRFRFSRSDPGRIPVFSAGVSLRANLFGFAVGELFFARPFERPNAPWQWGVQLVPGW